MESTTCSVHLWRFPSGLDDTPWGKANSLPSEGNVIQSNMMAEGVMGVQLRGNVEATYGENTCGDSAKIVVDIESESQWNKTDAVIDEELTTAWTVFKKLVAWEREHSNSASLGGREAIVMTEWGPWDHQAPLLRQMEKAGARHVYEMLPAGTAVKFAFADSAGAAAYGLSLEVKGGRAVVVAENDGYAEYQLIAKTEQENFTTNDWFLITDWQVTIFPSPCDPREDAATWRVAAQQPTAVAFATEQLTLVYGSGGPGNLAELKGVETGIGKEGFGTIAHTSLQLKPGLWRFQTRSDDGVRVLVNGKLLFENWTWHGPTLNEGILEVVGSEPLEIVVEHFELDGYATLELEITPFH
jgi:hypothetical protein